MIHGPHPLIRPWLKPSWLPKIAISVAPEPLERDCLLWLGARTSDGYGCVRGPGGRSGKVLYLHRMALEHRLGEPLGEFEADHLCRRRNCFEDSHLVKATYQENTDRSDFMAAGRIYQFSALSAADWLALADTSWIRVSRRYA